MCEPTSAQGAMVGAQAGIGIGSAYGSYRKGKQNQEYYNYLAAQSEKQLVKIDEATDDQITEIEKSRVRMRKEVTKDGEQTKANQIVSMAANGVLSDSNLGEMILSDTEKIIEEDVATVEYNSRLEKYRTRLQGLAQKSQTFADMTTQKVQGGNARASGNLQAMNTLLSSGISVGTHYAKNKG